MKYTIHNAWFWFSLFLVVIYITTVYVVLPAVVSAVTIDITRLQKEEDTYTKPSIFVEENTGKQTDQGYILQPTTNVQKQGKQ